MVVANVTSPDLVSTEPLNIEDVLHGSIQGFITLGKNLHIFWYIIGFVGNAISIRIWTLPQMYEICSYAMYLTAISVCDILCLFLHIFYYSSFFWNVKSLQKTELCETWTIIYMLPQYVSLFLVIGFIIQKLMAISDPFLSNRYLPRQNAAKQIVGIVIFVTTLSFPLAYLWKTENRGDCERNNNHFSVHDTGNYANLPSSTVSRRDQDSQYILLYWLTDIGTYIPLITLVLSVCIIIKIIKSTKRQVVAANGARRNSQSAKIQSYFYQSTLILLSVAFFRIITYLPNTVLLILRRLGHFDPFNLPLVYSVAEAMTSDAWVSYMRYASSKICCDLIENSHLALGILVYSLSSRHYRKEMASGATRLFAIIRGLTERSVSALRDIKCNTAEDV